ncbi:MAG TPA: hypothetical protein VER79_13360 [Candidatus Limnocylindrales bacterium]|nr:hypothetical protein [Candidatus Limnocylindrales bacterium]
MKILATFALALALIALVVMMGRALLLFEQNAQLALAYPYNLNYGEGPLLDQAARLARSEGLYSLTTPPYLITNYPPLYMLTVAPFVDSYGPSFLYGRVISLLSIGLSVGLLAGLLYVVTGDWLASVIGGGLLPAIPYIFYWAPLARIDSLALALSLGGLYLAVRATPTREPLFPAALLLALAVYTRQTYLLAAPLAAFVWVVRMNGWMRGLALIVWLGVLVVGSFVVLLVWTQGGIWFHLITANANALDAEILIHYAREVARYLPVLLLMLALFLVAGLFTRAPSWWLVAPYALGGLGTALTIAKIGSDVNYLYELSAALCLSAGALLALVRTARRGRTVLRALLVAGLALQVGTAVDLSARRYAPITAERVARRPMTDALFIGIRARTGVIVADEAMGLLALSGQPLAFQPFEMSALARAGLWDQSGFIERLARGVYPTILIYNPSLNPSLRQERWTPAMLRALNTYYRPLDLIGETTIYSYAAR